MQQQKENLRIQQWVVAVALSLFCLKALALYLTHSVAVLTDALESTVNVIAALIGWYSLHIASKPKDADHPYGHGKAEFLSAAIEGTLIIIAGFIIIYESINNLVHPHELQQLDTGILLVGATALANYIMGYISIRKGRKNQSLALVASGKHLQSDTYSTLGIMVGLVLIYYTGFKWIDSATAILFSFLIIFTGYRILRQSIAGIMDEADHELLEKLVWLLNKERKVNWIDLHNLRVIKYGGQLHIDCHLTVPWFLNVHEAHREIDALSGLIRREFGSAIELFVHTDGCLDFSCNLCQVNDCKVRKHEFIATVTWTAQHLRSDSKHRLPQ